jgi:diguanylate cyclase (GGDEF)-like protein
MTSPVPRLVFVVEEDPDVARHIVSQLANYNYPVAILTDVQDLQARLDEARPVALIMSLGAGGDDLAGARALTDLRKEGVALPPVIFLSSRDDIHARLSAIRAGGEAYFTRPVEFNLITDTLDRLLSDPQAEPYYVLVVEDSPSQAMLYARILEEQGMVVRTATDPLQVLSVLEDFPAELILMDVYMPNCSGIELAQVLRQQNKFLSVPIVFLSAETDLAKQHAAFRTGGDDFLVKPIQPEFLVSSVCTRADRYRSLRTQMVRDSLTGLLNHTAFIQHLAKNEARCLRQHSPLSLAMIDIDHFKQVNDTYGHPVGDQVIRNLARLLQQRLRRSDIIGRYGGEEFAVVMPDTPASVALNLMELTREAFAHVIQNGDGKEFSTTFSCGIAELNEEASRSSLIDVADTALYQAKRAGRNRVVLSS